MSKLENTTKMATNQQKNHTVLVLDNIRSTHNVGAIFRTGDAVGITRIYLSGITPAPLDRFGRVRADVGKAALGAEKSVAWESVKNTRALLKKLKKEKYTIIAIEQSPRSIDYKKVKVQYPVAFVLGPEVEGISEKVLKLCDVIAEIPMIGEKESLNVSVAAGVALFRMLGK